MGGVYRPMANGQLAEIGIFLSNGRLAAFLHLASVSLLGASDRKMVEGKSVKYSPRNISEHISKLKSISLILL